MILPESLASCPSADNVDRNLYFIINMVFVHQLQETFPKATQLQEFTSKLTDIEHIFPVCFIDLTD